ncbi:MalY/PatB family protein [Lonepinella sp. BR2930]|uniref:MalY/PatB family protein n=1 Tax=Lonepinella sp. BR2930 TaxID=3434554 RepID=UPI003F6DFFBE
MKINGFDNIINRLDSNSAKWDSVNILSSKNVIPMSTADMDISSPTEIIYKLDEFNRKGIYGYTIVPNGYYEIVKDFLFRHYNYTCSIDDIIFCPRIIQAISIYIKEFTNINDNICILTPSYSPIYNAVILNGRNVIDCKLIYKNKSYYIDFTLLEECFKKSKVFILISPHNPTGTVWSLDELNKICFLAEKYNVFIISDDVHADFDFTINKHYIISAINEFVHQNSMICTSPAKTFNIPGLEIANLIIHNKIVRDKFLHSMKSLGIHNPNYFSIPALITAYTKCDIWIDELKSYISQNKEYTINFFEQEIPQLEITKGEGTYLMWINYEKLLINEEELKHWFIDLAGIEASWGSDFDHEKIKFFRLNIAMPRKLLEDSLRKLKNGFVMLQQEETFHEYTN